MAICLAPQNSRTSVGLYKQALLGESGEAPFAIDFVEEWHDHPLLIQRVRGKVSSGLGARVSRSRCEAASDLHGAQCSPANDC